MDEGWWREQIDREIATHGDVAPPWAKLPWIEVGSIGWRMGIGEGHAMLWHRYLGQRVPDLAALRAHLARHPKAPRTWRHTIVGVMRARGGDRADIEAALADDVAYGAWVANGLAAGGIAAPWTRPASTTPAEALRYGERELSFWARWIAGLDPAARVGWRATQPAAPRAWKAVDRALTMGVAPRPWRGLQRRAWALVADMTLRGELMPPWAAGLPPYDEISYEDDRDDRHQWVSWTLSVFDDAASWRAYLARWPAPPAWDAALAELTAHHESNDGDGDDGDGDGDGDDADAVPSEA